MSQYRHSDNDASYHVAPERVVYDGKRLRKALVRKTCDFNSTVAYWVQQRLQFDSPRDTPCVNPCPSQIPELLPALAYKDPANAICTRHMHTSMNKVRCPINVVTWVPNARRVITGTSTGEFTLWNGLTFNFETIQQAHDTPIRSMVWSKDERWLISGDGAGIIKYWQTSLNNVKEIRDAHGESVRGIALSPSDLKFASCGDDGKVKVFDFVSAREELALTGHGWDVKSVDWHPQKNLIVSGSKDNLIKLWDPKAGLNVSTLHGHKHTVTCVKFSPNGHVLATGARDQLVQLYDIRTLRELQTLRGHRKEVTAMAWHPFHESLLATGDFEGSIMYWNVGTDGNVGEVTQGHDDAIWSLDWHPLGHILCSGSNDRSTRFWIRNRPGDPMDDKFNTMSVTGQLPPEVEVSHQRRGGDARREFSRAPHGRDTRQRTGANTAPLDPSKMRSFPGSGGGGPPGGPPRGPPPGMQQHVGDKRPRSSPGQAAPPPRRSRFS